MYPRVKVRVKVKEQEHEDHSSVQEKQRNSLLLLKVLESLSLQDRSPDIPSGADLVSSAVNEYQNASPPSIARIPKSYVPGSAKRSVSVSKGAGKNNKETNEDNRPNIRASSVPRPRAVLSSPDNDEMIGNKNKLSRERPLALKMHNLEQKRPADRRSTERHIIPRSPAKNRSGSKEAADKKSDLKGKESPELTGSRQKAYLRKGKLGSTGI